jgi:hypothetical protein
VIAQAVELGEKPGARGGREAEHGDDARDADRDPEGRPRGAHPLLGAVRVCSSGAVRAVSRG